jgi:hypothetical protein
MMLSSDWKERRVRLHTSFYEEERVSESRCVVREQDLHQQAAHDPCGTVCKLPPMIPLPAPAVMDVAKICSFASLPMTEFKACLIGS